MEVTTVGVDLAKNVFQVHGADRRGKKVFSKKLSRSQMLEFFAQLPSCLVAMEACGGAHYWARKLLGMGHDVKLISPQFVKPFVKSNKNDRNDAEAIVEAALRPSMRFVPIKSVEQQDVLCLHRVRSRLVASRTALINEIRGLLSEYGIVVAQGAVKLRGELAGIIEDETQQLSARGRVLFARLSEEIKVFDQKVSDMDREIQAVVRSNELYSRMLKVPGVGPITATALAASVGNACAFKNGRQMSGYLGLVPRQNCSGGKQRLGGISKRGDAYLRTLLIHGARAVLRRIERREDPQAKWLKQLIARRGVNRTAVALANKNARVLWALMARGEVYRAA